jgi:hypothetical protein
MMFSLWFLIVGIVFTPNTVSPIQSHWGDALLWPEKPVAIQKQGVGIKDKELLTKNKGKNRGIHRPFKTPFLIRRRMMGGLCPKRLSYLVENIAVLIRLVPVRSKSEGTTVFSCQLSLYHRMIGIHISPSEFGSAFLFCLLILQDVVYHPTRNPNYEAKRQK